MRKIIFEGFDSSQLSDYDLWQGAIPTATRGPTALPDQIPRKLYEEVVRRQMERADQEFAVSVASVVRRLAQIATDPEVSTGMQLKAIEMLLDRMYGKPTTSAQVHLTAGADSAFEGPTR